MAKSGLSRGSVDGNRYNGPINLAMPCYLSSLPPHENCNWVNLLELLYLLESGETALILYQLSDKAVSDASMCLLTDYLTDYVLKNNVV